MKLVAHLKERGMNPKLYSYSKSYSASCVTFFLYNLTGQIVGYHQYRPLKTEKKVNNSKTGRYFTFLPKKTNGLFGIELLDYSKKNLYIVEGVFKAANLHRLGYNAIAVLTSSPAHHTAFLKVLKQTFNVIAIGDNDGGGKLLVKAVGKGVLSPVDIDEMEDKEIHNFLLTL